MLQTDSLCNAANEPQVLVENNGYTDFFCPSYLHVACLALAKKSSG